MVFPSSLGGVPVLSLPNGKRNLSSVSASPTDGGSTCALSLKCRPAQYHSCRIADTSGAQHSIALNMMHDSDEAEDSPKTSLVVSA